MDELATQMRISAMMLAQLVLQPKTGNVSFNSQTSNNNKRRNQTNQTIVQSMKQAQDQFGNVPLEMLTRRKSKLT